MKIKNFEVKCDIGDWGGLLTVLEDQGDIDDFGVFKMDICRMRVI